MGNISKIAVVVLCLFSLNSMASKVRCVESFSVLSYESIESFENKLRSIENIAEMSSKEKWIMVESWIAEFNISDYYKLQIEFSRVEANPVRNPVVYNFINSAREYSLKFVAAKSSSKSMAERVLEEVNEREREEQEAVAKQNSITPEQKMASDGKPIQIDIKKLRKEEMLEQNEVIYEFLNSVDGILKDMKKPLMETAKDIFTKEESKDHFVYELRELFSSISLIEKNGVISKELWNETLMSLRAIDKRFFTKEQLDARDLLLVIDSKSFMSEASLEAEFKRAEKDTPKLVRAKDAETYEEMMIYRQTLNTEFATDRVGNLSVSNFSSTTINDFIKTTKANYKWMANAKSIRKYIKNPPKVASEMVEHAEYIMGSLTEYFGVKADKQSFRFSLLSESMLLGLKPKDRTPETIEWLQAYAELDKVLDFAILPAVGGQN